MKKIKVGLIIPYNIDRGFLEEAKSSARGQIFDSEKIEVFLIVIHGKNRNVSENINAGVRIAKKRGCEFVKYFAEDDLLMPNCISDSVQGIIDQDVDFIHGDAITILANKRQQIYRPPIKTTNLCGFMDYLVTRVNPIHGLSQFWRMSVFDKIGFFNVNLKCAEEHEFTLRALAAGLKMGYINIPMGKYRIHDRQKSLGKGVNQAERARIVKDIHDEFRKLCQG